MGFARLPLPQGEPSLDFTSMTTGERERELESYRKRNVEYRRQWLVEWVVWGGELPSFFLSFSRLP